MSNELNTLQLLKDNLSMTTHGLTKEDAHRLGICIQCKQKIVETTRESNKPGGIYSNAGHQEYGISGICEFCFDELFRNE